MAEGPNIWNIGDDIVLEIFVADPLTGLGLDGQAAFIEVTVRRDSDTKYWDGGSWESTKTVLPVIEFDSVDEPGRYIYTLNGTGGNVQADRYVFHVKVDSPGVVQGSSYEAHVSRQQDVKLYEAEPA